MRIDKKSPIPVYYQLRNKLMDKIKNGDYPVGSLIPSERDLSDALGISRMTVRQALNQLVSEGILIREKGRGTFVTKPKIEQSNLMSFSEITQKRGLVPSTRILLLQKAIPDDVVQKALELGPDQQVFILKRLRLADNIPIGIEETYIPEKNCPSLDKHDMTGSLYAILKDNYGYTLSHVDNVIEAALPLRDQQKLLSIPSSIPVVKITSIFYTDEDLTLLFERAIYRSDEYKYNVRVYSSSNP